MKNNLYNEALRDLTLRLWRETTEYILVVFFVVKRLFHDIILGKKEEVHFVHNYAIIMKIIRY
ncbi:hypothetical protein Ctaglu_13430 [Clostridium tagluense]|uniref:Uncharacterized protein n=1 Tax=Clostridium tagluense TaxID=360422 RepID=A0A401UJI2_9CLOT|nr:hypothetical protein Ctaglu_13430 [Clostridium tagluense]